MNCAIRVEGLQKSYAGRAVLKGLTFTVEQGEIFALLGVNGAGKTTLLDVLSGTRTPDSTMIPFASKSSLGIKKHSFRRRRSAKRHSLASATHTQPPNGTHKSAPFRKPFYIHAEYQPRINIVSANTCLS